jgi:hypothetical protein
VIESNTSEYLLVGGVGDKRQDLTEPFEKNLVRSVDAEQSWPIDLV